MSLLQMQHETKTEKDQKPNQTGIPSYMKQDFEARSGLSYDDVRIHYSSPKPAEMGALAYTQGTQVYIGPGQERHLPHELVHVAQQKRGEVRPTGRLGGVSVNDDPELERQADGGIVVQRAQAPFGPAFQIVQRKIGMEYQTVGGGVNVKKKVKINKGTPQEMDDIIPNPDSVPLFTIDGIAVTADGGDLEYVTPAVDTPKEAWIKGNAAAAIHKQLKAFNEDFKVPNFSVVKTNPQGKYWKGVVNEDIYYLLNFGDTAHPQATVGIKMNKIADLLADLGGIEDSDKYDDVSGTIKLDRTSINLPKEAPREQMQTMRNGVRKAQKTVDIYLQKHGIEKKNVTDYDSIVGILSLLHAYNEQFYIITKFPDAALNAKNAMPVMSRTSLYDAYLALDTVGQTIFKSILEADVMDIIIADVIGGVPEGQEYGIGWLEVSTDPEESNKNQTKHPLAGQTILAGERSEEDGKWTTVSLEDWLYGLLDGKDALRGKGFSSVGSIADSTLKPSNKFGVTRSTDIGLTDKTGKSVPGLLVELRGLERDVKYDRWGLIAGRVAFLVDCLNREKKPNVKNLPGFLKEKKS